MNGRDGTNGQNGASSQVRITDEGPGAHCRAGGQRLDIGPDTNANGALDDEEVARTSYVCNGGAGTSADSALVNTAAEGAGGNCAHGGVRVDAGVDTNSNQTLDPSEVTTTTFVCNGSPGQPGNSGLRSLVSTQR